ncbi:membrane-bound lytic murein transglycosylase A [Klebsiella pneumoniae]|nr:membrane-bound lytic murein transglycosylase A [Klebsiella pneumoniae]
MTQAAVSHQIKSLEDFLGLKLFRRRNRSLLLTEEGQSYFQDIKEIFSQLTEATRKLQARSAKGALTVSLLPSFAIQWLVPRLTSFNSAYPELLEQNPSFVFFKPQSFAPVKGASAVPLIGRASVASDRSIIPPGTTLLAEVPLLDNNGKFNGQYELRLMVALDVGGAIKGQHFDIYQGIGPDAGHRAGWYNHYGRVWVLKNAPGAGNVFSG